MSDPEEITIIVHSAKNLQGKKAGRNKFSVIFGLGGTKFRTQIVKEPTGNPDWNEETVVNVSNILDQVFFIVTEKDDILGQILIPVTSLRAIKGQAKRAPLQPHKKCPKPTGEIIYQCYVSKFGAQGDHVPIIKAVGSQGPEEVRPRSAFQRLKKRMASPSTQRRNKKDDSPGGKSQKSGLAGFNKKFSRSIQDLFSFNKFSASDSIDIDDNVSVTSSQKSNTMKSKYKKRFSLSFLSVSNDLDKCGGDPVISSCSPNSGPIDRPTRITVEGKNLGIGKSDILSLKVAGCDCTDTIEFESSSRIICTTHFWKVCKGAVVIDTISGGIGTLKDGFTFYEELDANENMSSNPFDNDIDSEVDKTGNDGDIEFHLGGKEIKSGSNTVPRIRSISTGAPDSPMVTSTPASQGRYAKKHVRRASESATIAIKQTPVEHVSKEELQARIQELETENAGRFHL
ncbi:EXOC2-like protein [Mya arenaria]|uniref:EXOC2-like protein n=1 Tax=Mya arenaria TaxID=6604 RepID=A0ABY7DUU2_MYAAR|nr:EXOC2-like protein [Mya arenaria]